MSPYWRLGHDLFGRLRDCHVEDDQYGKYEAAACDASLKAFPLLRTPFSCSPANPNE